MKNFQSLLTVVIVRPTMTLINKQKYFPRLTAGDVIIVLLLIYAIRSWSYMQIPAQLSIAVETSGEFVHRTSASIK